MSDLKAVAILARIRDCRVEKNCGMDCENCPHNYTEAELVEAITAGISACVERGKE